MNDRLFVAVIGERDSGKSTTWNELFGAEVHTGRKPRPLDLGANQQTNVRLISGSNEEKNRHLSEVLAQKRTSVFLISGSSEEKRRYASKVLRSVDCRIVLCSVQYEDEAFDRTWEYVFQQQFCIFAQWLNPGHHGSENFDRLGLVNRLLAQGAVVSIRDGRDGRATLKSRVEEIRQFIDGWAAARDLIA